MFLLTCGDKAEVVVEMKLGLHLPLPGVAPHRMSSEAVEASVVVEATVVAAVEATVVAAVEATVVEATVVEAATVEAAATAVAVAATVVDRATVVVVVVGVSTGAIRAVLGGPDTRAKMRWGSTATSAPTLASRENSST